MNIQQLFKLGMKRDIPQLLDFPPGIHLNLGAGASTIEGATNLDWPDWDAENYLIEVPNLIRNNINKRQTPPNTMDLLVPCPDACVAGIHAYHFLEHLTDPRRMLREMDRVLVLGGVVNICVPHHLSQLSYQDLDHKHHFALETWRNTIDNSYYNKGNNELNFRIHANFAIGIVERNLSILTQLVKEKR